ncbi:unnamed protein product [Sphenostylis stenocarpa]|uniref:Uncharacterized protein n=1 Tax=Sphenostylis stenocarpa TaxID=92480 RepID=A0AA86SJD5_9FABA|nr:unnamed protein product [Sphenostylis stenocarpa]
MTLARYMPWNLTSTLPSTSSYRRLSRPPLQSIPPSSLPLRTRSSEREMQKKREDLSRQIHEKKVTRRCRGFLRWIDKNKNILKHEMRSKVHRASGNLSSSSFDRLMVSDKECGRSTASSGLMPSFKPEMKKFNHAFGGNPNIL